ncbi:MAG TPA: TonB-dependent receptor [Puia sp.]
MKDTVQMKEAVVRGVRPPVQQTVAGITVNVENSILSKGSTVLEVLERSPGIIIDRRNNNISLNGKEGIMVMLNGKLMRMPVSEVMTLLQGMSADDIEKIELLTSPPAQYDAEGSAGLVNIVLKKNRRRGTNGNFSLTGGYAWAEKGVASFRLEHNTQRLNVYGSYTFSHDRTYSDTYITSSSAYFPVLGGPLSVIFMDTTRVTHNNQTMTAGMEARITSKSTFGVNLVYSRSSNPLYAINNAGYNVLPDSLLSFEGHIHLNNGWNNLVSSAWIERKIKAGEKVSFDIDYLRYDNNNPSVIQSVFTDKHGSQAGSNNDSLFSPRQRGEANTIIQVGVIKIDYEMQLNKKLKWESGIKGTYTRSKSLSGLESVVNGEWVRRTEAANDIVMGEGIGAAYASATIQPDAVTSLSVGGRYEYARTRMKDRLTGKVTIDRSFGAIFPSLFFSRKLGERSELQLSYTRRISRPTYNDLASFVGYIDPMALFTGNSFLLPTITNNVKLGYRYKNYTFSLLYSKDDHPIVETQLTESPNGDLMYVSPQNMRYRKSITLQTTLPWKINSWWNMSYSLVGGWKQFREDYTSQPLVKSYWGYSLNFTQNFQLPKNYSAELSGWYNAPSYDGTIRIERLWALSMGFKKELKNNAGALQLSVSDVLRAMQVRIKFGTLTHEAYGTVSNIAVNTESRTFPVVKLTYSRSFGGGARTTGRTMSGSQDEMERIRRN